MLLQLKQPDVEKAIQKYINGLGIDCAIEDISFTAGRGDNGLTVDLVLSPQMAEKWPDTVAVPEQDENMVRAVISPQNDKEDAEKESETAVEGKSLFA